MLKFKLDQESFAKLNEVEQTFYAQAGDGYQLQVEGATDKSKLDEFRATNVDLLKQQEQYKGVDLDKYRKLEEQERKLRDKELIEKGEFDTLVAERTKAISSDYQAKLDNLTKQLNEVSSQHSSVISSMKSRAQRLKHSASIKLPEAYDAVLSQIKSKFTIDNGKVIAKDGDNILTGANGNLTISEFVAGQPDIFKIPSSGGKGTGNDSNNSVNDGTARRNAYAKLLG